MIVSGFSRRGFTLVELSIVLVILGLLIGGVLTGQSLIHAAELRSITTQEQRYVTAIQTFKDKYFAVPGDMTNATSYWGAADGSTGNTAACLTAASTSALTCNGDGNGQVSAIGNSNERYRFWQHLANAGLIEGNYSGVTDGSTITSSTTNNSPSARISGSLWFIQYMGAVSSQTYAFDGQYDNALALGRYNVNNPPNGMLLKPEDVYNIDLKMDDGKPATGKVLMNATMTGSSTSCTDATASTQLSANYLLTNTTIACDIYFRQLF